MLGRRFGLALAFPLALALATEATSDAAARQPQPPCENELQTGTVCSAASKEAHRLFDARQLSGTVVIEDVVTGHVIVEASILSEREAGLPVSSISSILPLSTSKLVLAASIWTHADVFPDRQDLDRRVHELLVHSLDDEGRKLAIDERARVGSRAVLADLARYGLPECALHDKDNTNFDRNFAGDFSEPIPVGRACTTLNEGRDDLSWSSALSLGEEQFSLSPFHLARVLQAIGNDGVALAPIFRRRGDQRVERPASERVEIMTPAVARLLQRALRDTVAVGTAKGIRDRLRGGWHVGGKTGTTALYGEPFDGIFAGLVSDPNDRARYAFVVYVQRGGKGGGAAAEIACDLFNYALGL